MGFWIIVGHSILEITLIFILLVGFAPFFQHPSVIRGIGLVGGILLIIFGLLLLRDILAERIPTDFLQDSGNKPESSQPSSENGVGDQDTGKKSLAMDNPVVGGIIISMANPYWWVWWATIGMAVMLRFEITLGNWPDFWAFFLGHEAGDLLWYVAVSSMAFHGRKAFNKKIYYGFLTICALFMIVFGLYLGISPFFM